MATRFSWLVNGRFLPQTIGALLAAIMIILSIWNPGFLQNLRLKAFDGLMRQFPAAKSDTPIYIVDIDSKSLRSHGQWPWPRTIMARLVNKISAGHPKVIGFDIVFAEPDRTAPRRVIDFLASDQTPEAVSAYLDMLPDPDQALARALADGPTVLGHVFVDSSAGKTNQPRNVSGRFAIIGPSPQAWVFRFSNVDVNLPLFEHASSGSGFFNVLPDIDGIVRNEPLLINYQNTLYPSLVLEMLRLGSGASTGLIRSGPNGIEAVQIGSYAIPTDEHGQFTVRFTGPPGSFRYISADDVLTGGVDPVIFRDSYVLIGTSAPGLLDIRATPTSQAFPGVEIHANALNTVLTGTYLEKPAWAQGAEVLFLLMISILLILLLPRIGAATSGLVLFLLMVGIAYFSYWSYVYNNLIVDFIYPSLTAVVLFTTLTFMNYLQEEQRSKKIRGAFSQYLSPILVNRLLKNPKLLTLSGEERCMSILFSDIRGFTSISETMAPQELCRFINQYLTPMTEVIMEHQGTVDKFIGDAIMAFWNAPLDDSAHAGNSCHAALAMQRKLKELNHFWRQQGMSPIKIGVGIHSGMVRVGNMGSEHRFDYTVMGDAVNLASRLEGITKLYGSNIVVSDATYGMLKEGDLVFRELDHVRVKGKDEAVTIFELVDEKRNLDEGSLDELARHTHALNSYYRGDFESALTEFGDLARLRPALPLYRIYAERCRHFLDNPPGANWDGVTSMATK